MNGCPVRILRRSPRANVSNVELFNVMNVELFNVMNVELANVRNVG